MRTRFGRDPDGQMNLFGGSRIPAKLRRRKGSRRPPDETALVSRLLAWGAAHPERLTVDRSNAGLFRSMRGRGVVRGVANGTADVTGRSSRGVFVAIECKVAQGEIRIEQAEYLRRVVRDGGWAFVCRDTVESFVADLAEAEAGRYVAPAEIYATA